jgi:hypothetical protein
VKGHDVALWAGVSAFFASLIAVGALDLLNAGKWVNLISAVIVAAITAGGVYSKQRLDEAKKATGDPVTDGAE